jgi:hypothetical protein
LHEAFASVVHGTTSTGAPAFASVVHGTTSTGAAGSEVVMVVALVELVVGTAAAAAARSSDVMA